MTATESIAGEEPSAATSDTLRRWSIVLALIWLGVAGWLLFSSDPGSRAEYSTLGHLLLFGAIAGANSAVALTFATDALSAMRAIWIAAVFTGGLAVVTEGVQHLLPLRAFEVDDLAMDVTGIAIATVIVLGLLTILRRPALIELLVGALVVGLALLGVALIVLATQPSATVGLVGACPSTSDEEARARTEVRLRLTPPTEQGGCVAADAGGLTPILGEITWSDRHKAANFNGGGLLSEGQPGLAEAIRSSGEFTVAIRLRPEDLYQPNFTRWVLEVVEPDRPGRPLVRVLQVGRQIRSDVTAGDKPGDVAMLATASAVEKDEWAEVVVVVDDERHQMFVDGELQGMLQREGSELLIDDDIAIMLGLREITPQHQFRGQISHVVVLPRAVEPDEFDALFDEP